MTLPATAERLTCQVCAAPISPERLDELEKSQGVPNTCSPRCAKRRHKRRARASQVRRGVRTQRPPRERVEPVLGPTAKAAMRVETGSKRRRLLVLIAAFADAGEASPAAGTLAVRLGVKVRVIDALLAALEREGLLAVERGDVTRSERNRYRVTLP